MRAGSVWVTCPECKDDIEVEVSCTVLDADETEDGRAMLVCEPDMADLWAHMWGHDG